MLLKLFPALFYTPFIYPCLIYRKLKQQESEDEEYKVQRERRKKKYTTEISNVATDYIHPDSDSDTDAD